MVLKMASLLSIHTCSLGAPILLEEASNDRCNFGKRSVSKPRCAIECAPPDSGTLHGMGSIRSTLRGPRHSLLAVLPSIPAACLIRKFAELLSIAFDVSFTHMYAPGVRRHVKAALKLGATMGEIMDVFKLCVAQGVQACNMSIPILGRRTCEGPLADAYEELVELRRRLIALQSTADGRRQLLTRFLIIEVIHHVIEWLALGIELLAVAVIVSAVIILAIRRGTVRYLFHLGEPGAYENYKPVLAKALLLGIELLVAADVVRTVALEPTLNNVAIFRLLVVVRTFLSWSMAVELEGRWPWQQRLTRGSVSNAGRTSPSLAWDLPCRFGRRGALQNRTPVGSSKPHASG